MVLVKSEEISVKPKFNVQHNNLLFIKPIFKKKKKQQNKTNNARINSTSNGGNQQT